MNLEAQLTEKRGRCSFGRRVLAVLLALVMLLEYMPMTAWAAWDGSGDLSGNMGSQPHVFV